MKGKTIIALILILVCLDQAIKLYVKTNFYYSEQRVVFDWFRIHFIENPGMAWGLKLGKGDLGKLALTLFRLIAVIWGCFYIRRIIQQKYHRGFVVSVGFIFAGALGNLLDSLFYGLIFEKSDPSTQNIAQAFSPGGGYAGFMYGHVVDMWYFPFIQTTLPKWVPFWGGDYFEFFSPVFNTADVWVSVGVITLLLFRRNKQ
ncbi:lipoprotein signal peptidase [Flaviaesturariibacter amylovorans]